MAAAESRSFTQFTQESTMHGIRYAAHSDSSIVRRIVWLLVIAACGCYFIAGTVLFMNDYTRKPINTKVKIKDVHSLKFPTITICNRNYMKRSKIGPESMPDQPELAVLQSDLLSDIYLGGQLSQAVDKYNWTDALLVKLTPTDPEGRQRLEKRILDASHSLDDTFIQCTLMEEIVNCSLILTPVKTDAGYCFQFNSKGDFTSHTAGNSGGIRFVLDTLTDEYYIGPHSNSEGFSIGFHEADDVHLVEELSYGVSPGFETSFILRMKEIRRVPPPADDDQSDCFDTIERTNPLAYHKLYSQAACYEECKVSFVIATCGCREIFHPSLNDTEACNIMEMLNCSVPATKEFSRNAEHLEHCHCQSKCNEVQYSARLSSYTFPSQRLSQLLNFTESQVAKMKRDYVVITAAYGQMTYELIEESIAYTGYDLIGGTMGVCIGASVLTLIEFIEFVLMKISRRICSPSSYGKGTRVIHPIKGDIHGIDS